MHPGHRQSIIAALKALKSTNSSPFCIGKVLISSVVFGAVVFVALVFGAVVFGALVFGAAVFGAAVFGAAVFGAVGVSGGTSGSMAKNFFATIFLWR